MTAEELKRKEEERARKKQKEKERIEQLKKEGKYLTKAQKEEKARNELKLQQMIAAGIKIGGPADGEAAKKPKFDKKSKGKKQEKVSAYKADRTCIRPTAADLTLLPDRRGEGPRRGCRACEETGRGGRQEKGGRGTHRPREGRGRGCREGCRRQGRRYRGRLGGSSSIR